MKFYINYSRTEDIIWRWENDENENYTTWEPLYGWYETIDFLKCWKRKHEVEIHRVYDVDQGNLTKHVFVLCHDCQKGKYYDR